jgi:hypothetical protein
VNLLVIANETTEGIDLSDAISRLAAAGDTEVLVVAPALNQRLRHWMSDTDAAVAAAEGRLERCVARLRAAGVSVTGRVGDSDPLQAIADALTTFAADQLLVSTHPEGRSHWLERDLIARACARFSLPVAHLVVDLDRQMARLEVAA